jgi:hypothetical protein
MNNPASTPAQVPPPHRDDSRQCRSIEWYSPGQSRVVEVNGMQILIGFVGRRGRRGRIAITAPPGTVFRTAEVDRPGHFAG